MSDFNIEVGRKLFRARKNLSMSRAELGKKVNLHETTVKRYEDGQIKSLDIEKLKEFARALDIDPAKLMGWEEKTEKESSNTISIKERKLLASFNKLNETGKDEAIQRIMELALIPKYVNIYEIDTIAAHNDYVAEKEELYKIQEDIEDMKNW